MRGNSTGARFLSERNMIEGQHWLWLPTTPQQASTSAIMAWNPCLTSAWLKKELKIHSEDCFLNTKRCKATRRSELMALKEILQRYLSLTSYPLLCHPLLVFQLRLTYLSLGIIPGFSCMSLLDLLCPAISSYGARGCIFVSSHIHMLKP